MLDGDLDIKRVLTQVLTQDDKIGKAPFALAEYASLGHLYIGNRREKTVCATPKEGNKRKPQVAIAATPGT